MSNGGITFGQTTTYIILLVLTVSVVFLSYVAKLLPDQAGLGSIAGAVPLFFGFLTHDLTDSHETVVPRYVTFVVVTLASTAMGALGYFSGDVVLTTSSIISFVIVFAQFAYHYVAADNGANAPVYTETWVTALTGLAITVLSFYYNNPNAGAAGIITTILGSVTSWFQVSAENGSITINPKPIPQQPSVPGS